jgi:hypothetical protein
VVGSIVDLAASTAPRMPDKAEASDAIAGVILPRLAVPPGADALGLLLAALRTPSGN